MSETKQLPKRSELAVELTWDLTKIFKDDRAFDLAYEELTNELQKATEFKGTLEEGASEFKKAIEYFLTMYRKIETIYVYAHLKNDQDTANADNQSLYGKASMLYAKVSEAISWFEPEVLTLTNEQIWHYFEKDPELEVYRHFIDNILSDRPHILSTDQEALLAGAGEIFDASRNTFSVLDNADLEFPVIENEAGENIQLTHGIYGQLMESLDRDVRKNAFKGIYKVYKQFRNTFASTLSSHVKTHNFKAKVRQFPSARAASLNNNHIPECVYDNLIEVVNTHLPLLHRYMALRKRLLNLEELHMYDLYTPVLGEVSIQYSYQEAKETALKVLQPLGKEYITAVKKAFDERWIDVAENQGKRSGAYSSGAYDTAPYILLNWHDSLDQLYTLVHEMGHSIHSYFTRESQPYVYGDYSIFLAEIASTTNENILTEYLLKTEKNPKVRAYVLNHYLDGFKGTVFRQTQFAEFEHFIHVQEAKGTPLTSEYLCENYSQLNEKYYGSNVIKDEEIAFEWTKVPHFYYNYYVFQYATGFSAATALTKKILTEEPHALEDYLAYLKSGSSDYPIEVMKKAGVDMTKSDYLEDAISVFETRLTEFEALIEELEK